MRILIDTNILISGLYFHGLPKKLLSEIDLEQFKICVNQEIISEYTEKIDKKFSKSKYILNMELREKIFSSFNSFDKVSNLKVCRDPDDDKFINCAIDAKAIYIVSGDNDLLELKNFAGIEIVTAREFYEKYIKPSTT
ncbi:MAG: putative toxin-antitoxin system toxin component, PIN family [Selenomonadaceae bacterium]|nr:putative toxin-antitoxin system toxin component, PIN family [Selenomonadaceae bacterium]